MNAAFIRRHAAKLLALIALVAIAGVICIRRSGPPEPKYQGRPLSYWLARTHGATTNQHELKAAIAQLGTNALPFLLEWLHYECPNWRNYLFEKTPEPLDELTIARAELRADACTEAFIYLGTNATSAIPELTSMACDTNAPDTAHRAMQALAATGPSGIQVVVAIAQNTNYEDYVLAVGTIGNVPPTTATLAALLQLLDPTNSPDVRSAAVHFLGRQTTSPDAAILALTQCFTNPANVEYIRLGATIALRDFGRLATNSLPALTNALGDPDQLIRDSAALAIEEIINPRARKRLRP